MRIRTLDKNGDWVFGAAQSDYARNLNAVILDIKMKLKEWQNDCFFALLNGIPWQVCLGYKNQKQLLDEDILRVIRSVDGVLNIFNFSSTVSSRKYTCQCEIYTRYSTQAQPFNFDTGEFING